MRSLKSVVKDQINHIPTDFVPYTLEYEHPIAKQLDAHYGGDGWMKQLLQSIHIVGGTFDTWDTMFRKNPDDPTVLIDAYGSQWTRTSAISHLDVPALDTVEYSAYTFPGLDSFLQPHKRDMMMQDCEAHRDQYLAIHIGAGLYELGWRMMGVQRMLESFICEPEMMDDMTEKLASLLMSFIGESVKLPADAIMCGDDWCDQRGCTFGIERWRRLYKPYYRSFFEAIHKSGKKAILHVCGNVSSMIPDLIDIGLDVLETVQPEPEGMNPYRLKKEYGKDLTFWGGLGNQSTVTFASPAQITAEIRKLREQMSVGGGYILAPSKPINDSVSVENAIAIYETFIEENMRL